MRVEADRSGERGFTALEITVVVVIAVIIAAISIPTVGALMRSSRLSSSASTLEAMMRTARTLAVASSSAYSCAIGATAEGAVVTVRDGALRLHAQARLEPGVALAPSHVGELEFLPDGSARMKGTPLPIASYTITLTDDRGRRRTLSVTGLTGMVGLEE